MKKNLKNLKTKNDKNKQKTLKIKGKNDNFNKMTNKGKKIKKSKM